MLIIAYTFNLVGVLFNRLIHRQVESDLLAQVNESIDKEKVRIAKLVAKSSDQHLHGSASDSQVLESMDTKSSNEEAMECTSQSHVSQPLATASLAANDKQTTRVKTMQPITQQNRQQSGNNINPVPAVQTYQRDEQMDLTSNHEQVGIFQE